MPPETLSQRSPKPDCLITAMDYLLNLFLCMVLLIFALAVLLGIFPRLANLFSFDFSKEVPLPRTEEIVTVTASGRGDQFIIYEDIPEVVLPRDIAIRVVEFMRPIKTMYWGKRDREAILKSPFIVFRITTRRSEVIEIHAFMNLGHDILLCTVNGHECVRGGEFHDISFLDTTGHFGGERHGECAEGFVLKDLVQAIHSSQVDGKDHSEEIELCLLELDAASGRRPVEELDRVREERRKRVDNNERN